MQSQWEPRACFPELRGSCGRRGAAVGADEALLVHLPLTSCCAAGLLTARTPIRVCGPGVGEPLLYTMDATSASSQKLSVSSPVSPGQELTVPWTQSLHSVGPCVIWFPWAVLVH